MPVLLNLNGDEFQKHWFSLGKEESLAVLNCCRKLKAMEWIEIYQDKGLHWEMIYSRSGPKNEKLYSIRVTKKIRAVVRRNQDFLEFLTLHADHDSAYQ